MKNLLLLLSLLITTKAFNQNVYTDTTFNIRIQPKILYAIDTNYVGRPDSLFMDLYKPIGDNNRFRPVLIIVHGGAWMFGAPTDAEVVTLATYMAKRGYAVAAIKYRLGMHMSSNVPNPLLRDPFNPNDQNPSQCIYPADTSEIIRGNYRGMQDTKSAIRFVKARHLQDSTCLLNYYVAGYSAGAFVTLLTGLMDNATEKPIDAFALPDAPAPDTKLTFCKNLNNPITYPVTRTRPDLGSVDGRTNMNGYTAKIKGVASMYGGLMDRANVLNILQGVDTPSIFMFHQECDIIVPFVRAPGNAPFNVNCLPLIAITPPFQNYTPVTQVPWFLGSKYLDTYFSSLPTAQKPRYKFNPILNGAPSALACLASPPCHSVPNVIALSDSIAKFFKPVIIATENSTTTNCLLATPVIDVIYRNPVYVYPNPFVQSITVSLPLPNSKLDYQLYDAYGRLVLSKSMIYTTSFTINNLGNLPHGFYALHLNTYQGIIVKKLLK